MDKIIFNSKYVNISLDTEKFIFKIDVIKSDEYNEEAFNDFLKYYKQTWLYIKENNLKYHSMISVLDINDKTVSLPLTAIVKLISVLMELNDVFDKCLHSTCLTINDEKWKDTINLILTLYKPPRPFKLENNQDEINKFFHCNKIVEK